MIPFINQQTTHITTSDQHYTQNHPQHHYNHSTQPHSRPLFHMYHPQHQKLDFSHDDSNTNGSHVECTNTSNSILYIQEETLEYLEQECRYNASEQAKVLMGIGIISAGMNVHTYSSGGTNIGDGSGSSSSSCGIIDCTAGYPLTQTSIMVTTSTTGDSESNQIRRTHHYHMPQTQQLSMVKPTLVERHTIMPSNGDFGNTTFGKQNCTNATRGIVITTQTTSESLGNAPQLQTRNMLHASPTIGVFDSMITECATHTTSAHDVSNTIVSNTTTNTTATVAAANNDNTYLDDSFDFLLCENSCSESSDENTNASKLHNMQPGKVGSGVSKIHVEIPPPLLAPNQIYGSPQCNNSIGVASSSTSNTIITNASAVPTTSKANPRKKRKKSVASSSSSVFTQQQGSSSTTTPSNADNIMFQPNRFLQLPAFPPSTQITYEEPSNGPDDEPKRRRGRPPKQ